MAQWDGRGLPPVARERLTRAREARVQTSLLTADASASLQSVGLDAVGEVMGCIVEHVGWSGLRRLRLTAARLVGNGWGGPPSPGSAPGQPVVGYRPYLRRAPPRLRHRARPDAAGGAARSAPTAWSGSG